MSELLIIDGPDGRWPEAGEPLRTDAAYVAAARAQHDDPSRKALIIGSSACSARAARLGVRVDYAIAPRLYRPRKVHATLARAIAAFGFDTVRSFGSIELVEVVARAAEGVSRCEHTTWRAMSAPEPTQHDERLDATGRVILVDPWPGSSESWTGRSIGMFSAILHRLGARATVMAEGNIPSLAWASELLEGLAIAERLRIAGEGPTIALARAGDIVLMPTPFGPEGWLGAAATIADRCSQSGAMVVSPIAELSLPVARSLDASPRSAAEAVARVLAAGANSD